MAKRNYSCALITGASNGIGRALARELAFRSDRLVLVARREELLRDVALELGKFCRVDFFAVDLADEHSLQKFLQALEAASIVPDLLVNNAGFGVYGSFLDTDSSRENEMVRLNIQALMVLSKWLSLQLVVVVCAMPSSSMWLRLLVLFPGRLWLFILRPRPLSSHFPRL